MTVLQQLRPFWTVTVREIDDVLKDLVTAKDIFVAERAQKEEHKRELCGVCVLIHSSNHTRVFIPISFRCTNVHKGNLVHNPIWDQGSILGYVGFVW